MAGHDDERTRIEVQERREAPVIDRANREAKEPPYVIRFHGQADGAKTPFDGRYLVSYDPEHDGEDPWGRPMMARVEATEDPEAAKHYPSQPAAWAEWKRQCRRQPTRPWDGRPNRPLTAFTIEVMSLRVAREDEQMKLQG